MVVSIDGLEVFYAIACWNLLGKWTLARVSTTREPDVRTIDVEMFAVGPVVNSRHACDGNGGVMHHLAVPAVRIFRLPEPRE